MFNHLWGNTALFRKQEDNSTSMRGNVDNQTYLPDNGPLAFQTTIPSNKLVPCVCGHEDIVQLIYKVFFQDLGFLVCRRKPKKKLSVLCVASFIKECHKNLNTGKIRALPENSPELSIGPG